MIEVVGTRADLLGECPIWDTRVGKLYSIDIDGRCAHRFDPSTGITETRDLPGRPGCLMLTTDPGIVLVAAEAELLWLTWSTGSAVRWRQLPTGGDSHRLNDGTLDRTGRLWVGSMHEDAAESTGLLLRVETDGTSAVVQDGVGVPNALAFSPSGTTMYYGDSLAECVWRYDYDQDSGRRTNREVFADFVDLPGTVDGATVDADGCYWIACVFGSALARFTPEGDIDRIIDLPVDKPTKPAFGGPDLDVLYVTSIGGGGSHPRSDDPGVNGRLLALDPGVTGVPEPHISAPI